MSNIRQLSGIFGIITAIVGSVIVIEGGYVNDPTDPGGATKYGITEEVARKYGYAGEMKDLSKEFAEQIYIDGYVITPSFHLVTEISPAVGHKLIDAGVNTGVRRSSLWFQKALNSLSRGGLDYPLLKEDGVIGPSTIGAFKKLIEKRGSVASCEMVIKLIDAQQATHYMNLVFLSQFTNGWVNHRIGNIPLENCKEYRIFS